MRAFLRRNPWIWIVLLVGVFIAGDVLFVMIASEAWQGVEVLE
jgi:nitrogen fixation protein FixH